MKLNTIHKWGGVFLALLALFFVACASDDDSSDKNAKMYTIIFNPNGGSIATPTQTVTAGEVSLTKATTLGLTRNGYQFKGWAKTSDAESAEYLDGGKITVTTNITLYAIWSNSASEKTKYSVSFDTANLADKISSVSKEVGERFTESDLPTPSNIKNNCTFVGWYFDSGYTQPFAEFTVEEDGVRLYAKFKDASGNDVTVYKISYVNDAPNADNSETTTTGYVTSTNAKLAKGTTRGRDGYLFDGWFYDAAYTQPVLRGEQINKDTTFYAHWVSIDDVELTSSASLGGLTYDEVSSLKWYTRSASRDADSGEYIYTAQTSFPTARTQFFLEGGIQTINGAVFWAESTDYSPMPQIEKGAIDTKGIYFTNKNTFPAETPVQISNLQQCLIFEATGAGTVTATVYNGTSSSVMTETKATVYLLDKNGDVIASKTLDNRGSVSRTEQTLEGKVSEAGPVYLVFFRNGDDGGGVYVKSVEFERPYVVTYESEHATVEINPKTAGNNIVTTSIYATGEGISRDVAGYAFDGWFYDKDFTKPVSIGDTLTSDVTFYAKWLSLKNDVTAGSSQNFVNRSYSDLATVNWYTKTTTKDELTGTYEYTKVSTFANSSDSTYADYYFESGIQKLGNAVVWQSDRTYLMVRVKKQTSVTNENGLRIVNAKGTLPITAKTVSDVTTFNSFVMITASEASTVVAHVRNGTSDSVTTDSTAVAALVDSSGNVIDAKALDNKKGSGSIQYTLSGEVPAGNVYLVFCRNDDAGGGLWVQDIGVYKDSTVSYENEFGSPVSPKTAKAGLITSDIDVTGDGITRGRNGYFFGGWFYDKEYTKPVLRGQRISEDVTFYARWISVSDVKSTASTTEFWDGYKYPSDWYKKTVDEKGNETYSEISSFTSFEPYYLGAGVRDIEGAAVYSETSAGPVSQIIGSGGSGYSGIMLDQNNSVLANDTKKIDLSQVSGFIAVTVPSTGTLGVSFYNIPSRFCTTTNAVVALVDKDGTVLAKQSIDNRTSDDADYTYCYPDHKHCTAYHKTGFSYDTSPQFNGLSRYVSEAGNVYVVFDRNGDEGGMVRVESITFTEKETTDDSDITEEPTKDDGSGSSAEDGTKAYFDFSKKAPANFYSNIKSLEGYDASNIASKITIGSTMSDEVTSMVLANDFVLTEGDATPTVTLLCEANKNLGETFEGKDISSQPQYQYRYSDYGLGIKNSAVRISNVIGSVNVTVAWRNAESCTEKERFMVMKFGKEESIVYQANADSSSADSEKLIELEQTPLQATYAFGDAGGEIYIGATDDLILCSILIEPAK